MTILSLNSSDFLFGSKIMVLLKTLLCAVLESPGVPVPHCLC